MRDTWGPPSSVDGWPEFDKKGKRIRPMKFADELVAAGNRGVGEVVSLTKPPATDECDEELGL